jgi:hypothetical protein
MSELLCYRPIPADHMEPCWIVGELSKIYWLSMLLPPTKHSSVYHVISWAEDQNRMYNNWQSWLTGLAKGDEL